MGKGIFYYAWGKKSYSKNVIYQIEEKLRITLKEKVRKRENQKI